MYLLKIRTSIADREDVKLDIFRAPKAGGIRRLAAVVVLTLVSLAGLTAPRNAER